MGALHLGRSIPRRPARSVKMCSFSLSILIFAENLGAFDTRLELDATLLWDVRENKERRFGETESFQQLRELYVEQPLRKGYTVAVGRRIITESGNAWVDGAELRYQANKRLMLGAYGGLRPEPNTYAPTTLYQTAGAFSAYRRVGLQAEVGLNAIFRDGLDRQFIYARTHYRLTPGLYVNLIPWSIPSMR